MSIDTIVDRGLLPRAALRLGIRHLLRRRLAEQGRGDPARERALVDAWAETLRRSPLVEHQAAANAQHYEVPAEFFGLVLGAHRKYSAALFEDDDGDLDAAEQAMLRLTCERARLENGQEILELGCGWGSLSLWMAERYPAARILAVSNSASQRVHVLGEAQRRGLRNLEVRTADIADFDPGRRFDRVVSVEMFEHVRNYQELFRRIAGWLRPEGSLFFHVFLHRCLAYPFESRGDDDWMARHFFTGGQMPSLDLFDRFGDHLRIVERWVVDGRHYARTAEAWLENLERRREEVLRLFAREHGAAEARRWFRRWGVFFMACAELFGYADGSEWMVGHYRLRPAEGAVA